MSSESIPRFGGLNSLVLSHAVKGGIVSLASLLMVFAVIFAAFFKALRNGKGLLAVALAAGMFSFMGHQVVDNVLRFPTINAQFWIVSGLLLLLSSLDSGKSGIEEEEKLRRSFRVNAEEGS